MGSDVFPYGNDLASPNSWLGLNTTKSREYLAVYIGGLPITAFYNNHLVAVFGLESLCAAVVQFQTLGIQAAIGPGRLVKVIDNPTLRRRMEDMAGRAEQLNDTRSRLRTIEDIGEINSAVDVFNACMGHGTVIRCNTPMSMNDFNGLSGAIGGVSADATALVGDANVYYITGEEDGGGTTYFADQQVYNLGGGSLPSIGFALAGGIYSIRNSYSATSLDDPDNDKPLEIQREAGGPSLLEQLGMGWVDLADKPYYRYFNCPEYIRNLPRFGPIPPEVLAMGQEYADEQRRTYQ